MNLTDKANIILNKIQSSENIVLTTHISPDGDAVGSIIGLGYYIRNKFKKKAKMYISSKIPNNLRFLNGVESIKEYDDKHSQDILNADLIIILDLNDLNRTAEMEEIIKMSQAEKIVIDHHVKPKEFADIYFLDVNATSTGELIWKLIEQHDKKITPQIANALYTAIMTDTGSFRFERTDAETHKITAELIEQGADPVYCYDRIYNRKTLETLKLLGRAISNIELYHDGKLSIMPIPEEDYLLTGAEDNTEGFVSNTLSVEDVEIGILMRERPNSNEIKISFRSKGNYSIVDVAKLFGGGGHNFACGAKVKNDDFNEVKDKLVREIGKLFKPS